MRGKPVILALGAMAFATSVSAAEEAGQLVFNNACRTCHTLKEGDNRLGPSLAGVVGRIAGSLPGYAYSDAMKNSGVTWDEATLDRFIENPEGVVSGNNMKPYSGMTATDDRTAIIAYLKAQSGAAQ